LAINASFIPCGPGEAITEPDIIDSLRFLCKVGESSEAHNPARFFPETLGRAIAEIKRLRREKDSAENVIFAYNAFLVALESWDRARKKK
jgi:hypothetical protein